MTFYSLLCLVMVSYTHTHIYVHDYMYYACYWFVGSKLFIWKDLDSKWKVEKVQQFYLAIDNNDSNDDTSRLISEGTVAVNYFIHRHLRYLYDKEKAKYVLLR